MRMRVTLRQQLSVASALWLAATVMACGDDGGTPGGTPDARAPDASMSGIDAGDGIDADTSPDATVAEKRAGTILIAEVAVTNDGVDQSGAEVSIEYVDPDAATVPAYPAGATEPAVKPAQGSCVVWVYDVAATEAEPTVLDEGEVTIGGSLSPIDSCALDGDAYACNYAEGTVSEGSTVTANAAQGSANITWSSDEFVGLDIEGMFVRLAGFTTDGNNGTFPISEKRGDDGIRIENPDAATEIVAAGSEPTYTILAGAGPTGAEKPFLDDTSTVTVSKAAGAEVAAFTDTMVPAAGEGLALSAGSPLLHEVPASADSDLTFFCLEGADDSCGHSPDGAMVQLMLVGRTTDVDVSAAGPTGMPAATDQYAVFQCRSPFGDTEIILPQAALQTILDTDPTRIETKLLRVTYQTQDDPDNAGATTDILAGHGLVGYTDITPPE